MLDFGFYNMDCIEGMKQFPDKYFDLAIVDPPYFHGPDNRRYYGSEVSQTGITRKVYQDMKNWEIPNEEYFKELERVSKHQIIWGCNYFQYSFPSGRIVWDKCNQWSTFSDCEIASCSLQDSVRLFRYMWSGMMQGKSIEEGHIAQGNKKLNEERIHITQKPVALYDWIIQKYAKQGDKILDTHVGSASSLIAFEKAGLDYVGFEIDHQMYIKAQSRVEEFRQQMCLLW